MSKKRAAVFYWVKKNEVQPSVLDPIKHDLRLLFNERLQKHSTKSVSFRSLNKGSKCEGKIQYTCISIQGKPARLH